MSQLPVPRRRRDRSVVAGVCAAVAERWQVDPTLVRVAAVLLALSGGIGLVLYAIAGLLMPTTDEDQPPIERFVPGASRWPLWVWVVTALGACLFVGGIVGPIAPFGIMPALVLAAAWYFGYRRPRQRGLQGRAPEPLPPADPAPRAPAAGSWPTYRPGRLDQTVSDPVRPVASPAATAYPPLPPASRVRSAAGRITPAGRWVRRAGLILVALSLLALVIARIGGAHLPLPVWLAVPTAALGLALVVGAFVGRPRGLAVVATLLLIATLGTSAAATVGDLSAPQERIVHTASDPAPTTRNLDVGTLDVDLSAAAADRPVTYRYSVAVGALRVRLPREGNVQVRYAVDVGRAAAPGQAEQDGLDLTGTWNYANDPDAPLTVIVLQVDTGSIEVAR